MSGCDLCDKCYNVNGLKLPFTIPRTTFLSFPSVMKIQGDILKTEHTLSLRPKLPGEVPSTEQLSTEACHWVPLSQGTDQTQEGQVAEVWGKHDGAQNVYM